MRIDKLFSGAALVCAVGLALSLPTFSRADLVGWWDFDDNVDDQSGVGNDGQLMGGVYDGNVPDAIGTGSSISFQADPDHVLIPADDSLNSDEFTLSLFIFDRGQQGALERLTSREGDTFETGINVHGPFSGMGELSYYSPAASWQWGDDIPPHEDWAHVAYVSTGSEMSIYLDGDLVHGPDAWSVAPSGFMHIGNRHNDVEGFDGLIDDVALWDEVLEPDSIATIAQVGVGGFLFGTERLEAGDANEDLEFSFDDILLVLGAGKFETGQAATWAEGDWDGAPGGSPGDPPPGDGRFDFNDILAALQHGLFEMGPYGAIGAPAGPAAVPEPSTLLLLAVGILAVVARRLGCRNDR